MNKPHIARGSFSGNLVCDLSAISPDDRVHYRDLRLQLRTAHILSKAIGNGYVVQLNEAQISMADVSEWIRFEGLCCPWLSIRAERIKRGMLKVRMEAPNGAKDLLRTKLQEFLPNNRQNEVSQ